MTPLTLIFVSKAIHFCHIIHPFVSLRNPCVIRRFCDRPCPKKGGRINTSLTDFVLSTLSFARQSVRQRLEESDPDNGTATHEVDLQFSPIKIADNVLQRLHAVLYVESNKVLWYHKSFPDFLFDQMRSGTFWCDESLQHRRLTDACFSIRKAKLKFNMASIPTRQPDFSNILTIPCSSASRVDFSHASLGPNWHNCYSP